MKYKLIVFRRRASLNKKFYAFLLTLLLLILLGFLIFKYSKRGSFCENKKLKSEDRTEKNVSESDIV